MSKKSAPRDIREIDGLEATRVSAEVVDSGAWAVEKFLVRIAVNDDCWPHQNASLTPVAARMLARHLLEFADEADLLTGEAADVDMACTVCSALVRKSFYGLTWEHREADAALACTATGPVKARVAAG
jgi:hypothetical protein